MMNATSVTVWVTGQGTVLKIAVMAEVVAAVAEEDQGAPHHADHTEAVPGLGHLIVQGKGLLVRVVLGLETALLVREAGTVADHAAETRDPVVANRGQEVEAEVDPEAERHNSRMVHVMVHVVLHPPNHDQSHQQIRTESSLSKG